MARSGPAGFVTSRRFLAVPCSIFVAQRQDLGYGKDQVEPMIAAAIASLDRAEGMDGDQFFAELEKEEAELSRHVR